MELDWIRRTPVTLETLIIAVVLYASCAFQATAEHRRFDEIQRDWGAIQTQHRSEPHEGVRRTRESEIQGPFELWNGEWWRVPLTAFHHHHLSHLLLSSLGLLYFGRILERLWGRFRMACFLFSAISIPNLLELAGGHGVMGLSGALYAVLGGLAGQRAFDHEHPPALSIEGLFCGLSVMALGFLTTAWDAVSVSNRPHVVGFVYGMAAAWLCYQRFRQISLPRFVTILLCLILIPGFLLVANPFWIGRYHWYRATVQRTPPSAERALERAIQRDPSLTGAWLSLAEASGKREGILKSWQQLITGLAANPSSESLIESARRLWRHLDLHQRDEAKVMLGSAFGSRAEIWLNSIRSTVEVSAPLLPEYHTNHLGAEIDLSGLSLDQKVKLDWPPQTPESPWKQSPQENLEGNQAVEGESL